MENSEYQSLIKEENIVFKKSKIMTDAVMNFCPGCGHGVVHRLITEIIEEMDIQAQTIGVTPVGCSVLGYDFMDIDMHQASHGRAPAVATGIKRVYPEKFVFTYQGDGDLAAIGTAETMHAANRGENFLMIFVNNGIYGMTGGQMAPTTLEGMKTATSPYGRDLKTMGHPLKITELVAQLDGVSYCTRQAVHTPAAVRKTKQALRLGFENQKLNKGLSFIEIVSNCNSGWKLSPVDANKWMEDHMFPYFPLGDLKK